MLPREEFRPIPLEEFEKLSLAERIEYLKRASQDTLEKLRAAQKRQSTGSGQKR